MAAQNMALASATSQLMSTAAGDPGRGTSTAGSVVTTTAHGTADITARVAALTAAMEAATSSNTTSPVTSETGGSAATAAKAAVACTADAGRSLHKKAGSTAGGVLNAAQAKEVGALLTRLAAENAAFLKAKDEAVTARDSAMNKVTALEVEMDMLRQQMRYAAADCCICSVFAVHQALHAALCLLQTKTVRCTLLLPPREDAMNVLIRTCRQHHINCMGAIVTVQTSAEILSRSCNMPETSGSSSSMETGACHLLHTVQHQYQHSHRLQPLLAAAVFVPV